ncbi:MAG: hypothetical protein ACREBH_02350 [Candidatus Micrarchaeaceae archaeon]
MNIPLNLIMQANVTAAANTLFPIIAIALSIDAFIIAIWYFAGSMLNNNGVKGAARGEFYQLIGTAILIGIVIGSLVFISSFFYSTASLTKLMSPTALSTMCSNIESSSQLDILGKTSSLLAGTSGSSKFVGICSILNSGGVPSVTDQLEYPLAAAATIDANLTNQTVANLNYSFTMDAWLGFLSKLSPTINLCIDPETDGASCIVPNPLLSPAFDLQFSQVPYAGYSLLVNSLTVLGTILNLSVQALLAQLLLISIFLYVWPWILFGGIVLRSTLFTRRLGGLFIAVAIAGLFIYPAVFSFEYLAVGNGFNTAAASGNVGGYNTTYGFNAITYLPGAASTPGKSLPSNYTVNFFVEPNIKGISMYYSCWPNILGKPTSLIIAEGDDIGNLLIPGASIISSLKYIFDLAFYTNSNPTFPLLAYCQPQNAVNTFYAMLNAYGIIGMASYLIPLINLVVTVSSVIGLSGMLGGDTSLAGIARIL